MSCFDLLSLKGFRKGLPGLAVVALMSGLPAAPAQAEGQVAISGEVNIIAEGDGETVAIGGDVKVSGRANDELVAIGGQVSVDVQSEGETVLVGGQIKIDGAFADELVAIGGVIDYHGANTEELVLIGGEVTVHEQAVSGGPAHIFGGEVILDGRFASESEFGGGTVEASGQFADNIKISAREVFVSGEFYGDLEIEGETIHIKEGAVIIGHLTMRSPDEPKIDETVELQPGSWTYEYIEEFDPMIGNMALSDIVGILTGALSVLLIFLSLTALAAFIVVIGSGRISRQASAAFRQAPGKSFLIGLATVLITGVVGAFFLVILIGPLLPLFVGIVGFFIAAYTLASMMFRKVGAELSLGSRVGFTAVGTIFLLALQLVPILGSLVVFVLSVIGMGAFVMALFNAAPQSQDPDMLGSMAQTSDEGWDDGHPREDYVHDRFEDDDNNEEGPGRS